MRISESSAVLTHSEAELKNLHGPLLLQEVHEAEEQVLLLPDLLQLQLQHLGNHRREGSQFRNCACPCKTLNQYFNYCLHFYYFVMSSVLVH